MTAPESIADAQRENVDETITRLSFKADGLMHRIVIRSQEAIAAVRDAAMKAIRSRDPSRGPDDFEEHDEERIVVSVREIERLMRRAAPGPGSVHGNNYGWVRDAAILVILGMSGWTLKTVIDQGKDIAVLKCQVDPQCRGALRVQP